MSTEVSAPRVARFYKVFISSTFSDLADHRQQASLGILRAGHMPVALENFTPESEAKRTVIENALKLCQFYVIMLGCRYGTIPEDQETLPEKYRNKSYTEIELEMALEAKLPILPFYINQEGLTKGRVTKEWVNSREPRQMSQYESLRTRLTDGISKPLARPFSKPDEIFSELYAYFQRDLSSVRGYILEPERRSDVDVILRFSSANDIGREIVEALGEFSDVDPRLAIAAAKKRALAESFDQLHGKDIDSRVERLFFESGSTVTYVARGISGRLPRKGQAYHAYGPQNVMTNNAFAYLYLWLCSGVMCHTVPEGPPDQIYGGMYGPLTGLDRRPNYDLPGLEVHDPESFALIKKLGCEIFPSSANGGQTLLIAAASGLQLSSDVRTLEAAPEEGGKEPRWVPSTDERQSDRVRNCRGFHVGSYCNMLFKRCYYDTKLPAVVFIHDDKVDCDVKIGKCHYLFDRDYTWSSFAVEYPLSIWTACERLALNDIRKKFNGHFQDGEWEHHAYGDSDQTPILISHNAAFRSAMQKAGMYVYREGSRVCDRPIQL
jgi:hypothetical protein